MGLKKRIDVCGQNARKIWRFSNGDFEHRLIAEKVLGKKLKTKHHVHHVDGNSLNNEHSNLVICESQAYHNFLHRRKRALEQAGDAHFVRCSICKTYDDPDNMVIKKQKNNRFVHDECKKIEAKFYRERR